MNEVYSDNTINTYFIQQVKHHKAYVIVKLKQSTCIC